MSQAHYYAGLVISSLEEPVLTARTHEGLSGLSGLDEYGMVGLYPAKVVTNPRTNRARRSLVNLLWAPLT